MFTYFLRTNTSLNEDLKKSIVSFTDSYSLHIPREYYITLKEKNLIRNGELGYLLNGTFIK